MSTEYDMEFDNLHALENFLDIYDSPGEAVVTEAIANSVDADSSRVDIKFGLDPSGKRIISFAHYRDFTWKWNQLSERGLLEQEKQKFLELGKKGKLPDHKKYRNQLKLLINPPMRSKSS